MSPAAVATASSPRHTPEPGQRIVDFSLGEQPLRLGHLVDIAQARPVTRGGLLGGRARGRNLHGRVGRDPARALNVATATIPLRASDRSRSAAKRAVWARIGGGLRGLPRLHGGQIRRRGSVTVKPKRVVLNVGREAIEPAQQSAVGFRAGAAGVSRALQIEAREIGPFERAELRLRLLDDGVLFDRDGIRGGIQAAAQFRSGGSCSNPGAATAIGPAPADELGDGRARHVDGLLGLDQLRARRRQLRFRAGSVRAGPQLRIHQRRESSAQSRFGAVHAGLRRAHCLLRRDQGQIGIRRGHGDIELGAF